MPQQCYPHYIQSNETLHISFLNTSAAHMFSTLSIPITHKSGTGLTLSWLWPSASMVSFTQHTFPTLQVAKSYPLGFRVETYSRCRRCLPKSPSGSGYTVSSVCEYWLQTHECPSLPLFWALLHEFLRAQLGGCSHGSLQPMAGWHGFR